MHSNQILKFKTIFSSNKIFVNRSYNSTSYISNNKPTVGYLSPNKANFVPLTPISTFNRTVIQNPSQSAYIKAFKINDSKNFDGSYRIIERSWKEVGERVSALASQLVNQFNVKKDDVVSIIAPNSIGIFEAHFAVPG